MSQQLKLSDFDISEKTGFVLPNPPLRRLPGEYFSSWEDTCARIPDLIEKKQLRAEIDSLPEKQFNEKTLKSEEEWRRAYVLLTFLSQAYIWAEGEAGIVNIVPKKLAVPWCAVSEHVSLKPVSTYATVVLYNYALRDPDGGIVGENLEAVSLFTGTKDESWFYMVHVLVEVAAVPGLNAIERAYEAMDKGQNDILLECLKEVKLSIQAMLEAMRKMYDKCDPETFYVHIRPFLSGSKGIKAFPEGIIYEGTDGNPRQYNGGSAAQTTSIPSFDGFLGAKHTGPTQDPTFMLKMREYQPKKHREFLEALDRRPSVREYIMEAQNLKLIESYNDIIDTLLRFRTGHITLIKRYIVQQFSPKAADSLRLTGTGGTPIETFLQQVKDSTLQLKIPTS